MNTGDSTQYHSTYSTNNDDDNDEVKILDISSQDLEDEPAGTPNTNTASSTKQDAIAKDLVKHSSTKDLTSYDDSQENTPPNPPQDKSATKPSEPRSWKALETLITWIALILAAAIRILSEIGRLGGSNTIEMTKHDLSAFSFPPFIYLAQIVAYGALAIWLLLLMTMSDRTQVRLSFLPLSMYGLMFTGLCALDIVWSLSWHFQQFSVTIVAAVLFIVLMFSLHAALRHNNAGFLRTAPLGLVIGWYLSMLAFTVAHTSSHYADPAGKAFWQTPLMIILLIAMFLGAYFMRAQGEWLSGVAPLWMGVGIGLRTMDFAKLTAILIILVTVAGAVFIYVPWKRFVLQESTQSTGKQ